MGKFISLTVSKIYTDHDQSKAVLQILIYNLAFTINI